MAADRKMYDVVMVRDPFGDFSPGQKESYIDVEKKARKKMREVSRNEAFNINIPRGMSVTMKEPESMTTYRRASAQTYMVRQDKMKAPVYRGRGRSMRMQRDSKELMLF